MLKTTYVYKNKFYICNVYICNCVYVYMCIHGKSDFAERSKILLTTDWKIILLDHQNNFVKTLKIMILQKILIVSN